MSGGAYDYKFSQINDLIDLLERKNKQALVFIDFYTQINVNQLVTKEFYDSFIEKYKLQGFDDDLWYSETPFNSQKEKDDQIKELKSLFGHRLFLIKSLSILSNYSKEIEWVDSGDSSDLSILDTLQKELIDLHH